MKIDSKDNVLGPESRAQNEGPQNTVSNAWSPIEFAQLDFKPVPTSTDCPIPQALKFLGQSSSVFPLNFLSPFGIFVTTITQAHPYLI